ncbi:MAG: GMC family oxidoreductase [Castellaniella sp.]
MVTRLEADFVIIGSGLAGSLIADHLSASGARVLVIEAGAPVGRTRALQHFWDAPVKTPESAYPPLPQAMHPVSHDLDGWYRQSGPDLFKSTYLKVVGGTTWHWLGTCLRLLPSDFRTRTRFGYGVDWPIDYATLEPFYVRAEHALGVSGDDDEDLGSPRSAGFVQPAIAPTYLDRQLESALSGTRFQVRATPQARNSRPFDGRPACCGSSSCIPVCPIQAKYDATVHLNRAVAAGAQLLDKASVVRLEVDETATVRSAHFRRWDGSRGQAVGKAFVIAANAVETPRLLLASRTAAWPDGLANSSGQLGRNLMDHPVQLSWALADAPLYPYRGPLSTSGIENLREGDFRRERSAYRIEIGNDGWSWPAGAPVSTAAGLAAQGLDAATLDATLAHDTARHLRLSALTEQLPEARNRVTLDAREADHYGVPLPRLHYDIGDYARRGLERARADHDDIMRLLGCSHIRHADTFFGAGHIMGTARMGADPRRSVVDGGLCSHDHPNLFLAGAGVFPTCGTANPSLTIAALSLRLAQALADRTR